jgi:hypothetical protein
MRIGPSAAGGAALVACLAVAGCGGGAGSGRHDVLLAAKGTSGQASLRYQVDDHQPVTIQADAGTTAGTSVDLRLKAGSHVAVLGTATDITTPGITCTVAVDGIVRATQFSAQPTDVLVSTPIGCETSAYVGHRPYGINRVLELLALVVCLLIVLAAVVALVLPRGRST